MPPPSASGSGNVRRRAWAQNRVVAGAARSCTSMAALVDTNVLVYRFDPRDKRKQQRADDFLREGVRLGSLRLPHQAILEFVAACTRALPGGPLLSAADARREAEELLSMMEVLYPN